jgi:alanine racemase
VTVKVPCATIDVSALRHNLAAVRRYAPASKVMAIIKANAYGHGLVAAALALEGVEAFGVARLEEGLALRSAGIATPIVLLEGVFNADELEQARRASLQIVVHSPEQIAMLEQSGAGREFEIWLKVDTGMNRLGFRLEQFEPAWQRLRALDPRALRVMTHLAAAEVRNGEATVAQLARFSSLTIAAGTERSVANSAGLILSEQARLEWVRPGLMLYGISPIPGVSAAELGLKPAMTLTTQLIAIRHVPAGETVGYNGIWRAEQETRVGIAAVGYGDGYPRNLRSGCPVLVNGRETQVLGRVSMDMTAVDLQKVDAKVGDPVTLWGEGLPVERVAAFADTIAYELVCGISQRVAVEWKEQSGGAR